MCGCVDFVLSAIVSEWKSSGDWWGNRCVWGGGGGGGGGGGLFFFQAEDGIRDLVRSRGLGDVYKRQGSGRIARDGVMLGETFGATLVGGDGSGGELGDRGTPNATNATAAMVSKNFAN